MLLQVEFKRYDRFVMGKVLHMDESLRSKGCVAKSRYHAYTIHAIASPSVSHMNLFIRGDNTKYDDAAFFCGYANATKAKEAILAFRTLIDKVNRGE